MDEVKTIKKSLSFRLNESDSLKKYLEEMALKGWDLKVFERDLTFEKMEPQKVIYAVEIFKKPSRFNKSQEQTAYEYVESWTNAGWEFVGNQRKMYIFKTFDENILPLESDQRQKYKIILRSLAIQNIMLWIAFLAVLSLFLFTKVIGHFEESIASIQTTIFILFFALFIIYILYDLFNFLRWRKKAKLSLKNNDKLFSYGNKNIKIKIIGGLFPIGLVIYFNFYLLPIAASEFINGELFLGAILITILIFITGGFSIYCRRHIKYYDQAVKKINPVLPALLTTIGVAVIILLFFGAFSYSNSKEIVLDYPKDNTTYSFSVYNSEIPLTLNDLGIKTRKYEDKTKSSNFSIFASLTEYSDSTFSAKAVDQYESNDDGETVEINYDIFDSCFSWVIRHHLKNKLGNWKMKQVDAATFGAKEVYVSKNLKSSRFKAIIVFDNRVISFESDDPLDDEKIKIVCNILAPDSANKKYRTK